MLSLCNPMNCSTPGFPRDIPLNHFRFFPSYSKIQSPDLELNPRILKKKKKKNPAFYNSRKLPQPTEIKVVELSGNCRKEDSWEERKITTRGPELVVQEGQAPKESEKNAEGASPPMSDVAGAPKPLSALTLG